MNYTQVARDATNIIHNLSAIANCSAANEWYYYHIFINNATFPGPDILNYSNDSVNINWLRPSLPDQYKNDSIALYILQAKVIQSLHGDRKEWGWLFHDIWAIGFFCKGPSLVSSIDIRNLSLWNLTNAPCDAFRRFGGKLRLRDPKYTRPLFNTAELDLWNALASQVYPNMSTGAAYGWMLAQFADNTHASILSQSLSSCDITGIASPFCSPISGSLTGNPDIGGIGVMAAYLFVSALATLVLIYWILSNTSHYWMKANKLPIPLPNHDVLKHFSEAVLDSAMFILLGVSIALCITRSSQTIYTALLAIASLHILLNCLVIFILTSERSIVVKRYSKVALCYCLGMLFHFYAAYMWYYMIDDSAFDLVEDFHKNQDFCFAIALVERRRWMILPIIYAPFLPIFPQVGWLLWFLVFRNPWIMIPDFRKPGFFVAFSFGVLQAYILWLMISLLILIRTTMMEVVGDSWEEADWGFGQVVALMTWIPVIAVLIEESLTYFIAKNKRTIAVKKRIYKYLLRINNRFFQWSKTKKKIVIGWNLKKRTHADPHEVNGGDVELLDLTQQPENSSSDQNVTSPLNESVDKQQVLARAHTSSDTHPASRGSISIQGRQTF